MIVLLGSSPLGILSSPLANPEARRCQDWLDGLIANGHRVLTSEICDYEVRRELRCRPTADPAALDADVILAAQAQLLAEELREPVIVVTTNARHLGSSWMHGAGRRSRGRCERGRARRGAVRTVAPH